MSQPPDNDPNALEDVLKELEALGEAPPDHAADALREATLLGDVLDAARHGADAIEALPAHGDEALPLAGLHVLRAASGEDRLDAPRAQALWQQLAEQLPDATANPPAQAQPGPSAHPSTGDSQHSNGAKVIAFPFWRAAQATFAAAAALLLLIGAALVIISVQDLSGPQEQLAEVQSTQTSMTSDVPQVELERAEARLKDLHQSTLKTLMAPRKSPTPPSGDHALRQLRGARQEAVRARMQARARRL